ncbi:MULTISPECIES: hypothetical protein [Desulfovibrio]|uniref:Asparagine synthase n=1 Tax=Desulfovibrio desulfuricans TaxID=876 RepID=A0AA94HSC8_DESDE|nr:MULTISPECIES: hypothetical protein [Desulfovibrio]SFW42916.1 hypothetical protein SAMN02910291_01273 [Desulfovibrio desulfuricans]SPD35232.1 Rossmann-like alpha/beta/alpha sandwich fold [Desulfovibrio sp. G11]
MANYLIVCADAANSATIDRWFSTVNESPADLHKIAVPGNNVCYYLANKGQTDATADGGIFKGYAVDHDKRSITFSGNGEAPNVHWPTEGCYIRLQRDHDDVVVGNDFFSQLPMLYFARGGIIAISDSTFILTELRRHLGLPNQPNTDAALSRAWVHGLASQPLGTSTLIDGIEFCTPGSKIRVNFSVNTTTFHIEKILASDYFSAELSDYIGTISECAYSAAAIIATFAQIPNSDISLSLSGGIDSRVCLAAAINCGEKESLFITTNPHSKDDYAIANELAAHLNFEFKNPPKLQGETKEQIPSWFLSCAGIYDPPTGGGPISSGKSFAITGVGAEASKGYFGWRPLSAITPAKVGYVSAIRPAVKRYTAAIKHKKGGWHSTLPACPSIFRNFARVLSNKSWALPKVDEVISEAAYRASTQGLLAVGIAAEDPWATEWHYLCFMNALHGGRSTMRSLLGISPLLQRKLVGLSRSELNECIAPVGGAPSIITDLLIALNPDLAALPFDEPQKNMAHEYVRTRATYLGTISNVEPYSIVGDSCEVNSGTPEMFIKIAHARGFKGNFTPSTIKQLAAEGFKKIPEEVRDAYLIPKYLVENELPERISPASWECKAAGKLMAFLLAD